MSIQEMAPAGANGDTRQHKPRGGFWSFLAAAWHAAVEALRTLAEGFISGLVGGREPGRPSNVPTRIEIA